MAVLRLWMDDFHGIPWFHCTQLEARAGEPTNSIFPP
jgi:hypothetical protein